MPGRPRLAYDEALPDLNSDNAPFRSKHAGAPGSITAIRLDYQLHGTAFDAQHPHDESKLTKVRQEVSHWKNPRRLGEKPPWDCTTRDEKAVFPQRPLLHTLSEFQTQKIPVDYRAPTIPQDFKRTEYVPKGNKFQFDRTALLPQSKKETLLATNLKRPAPTEPTDLQRGWNTSTTLDDNRMNIFKDKQYEPMRALNRLKEESMPRLKESYRSPQQRAVGQIKMIAEMKATYRAKLEGEERRRVEGLVNDGRVFKISNMHEWMDLTCGGIVRDPREVAAEKAAKEKEMEEAEYRRDDYDEE